MTTTVLGIFSDRDAAVEALNELKAAGYNPKNISIVMRDQEEGRAIAQDTGAQVAEGAVTGATTGAVLGGLAGFVSAVAIPGLGAFFIGGPIAAALGLSGAAATTVSGAVTGAAAGGILGALTGFGVPEHEAREYETSIREGGILLAVPTNREEAVEVTDILEDCGATKVRSVHAEGTDRFEKRAISRVSDEDIEMDETEGYTTRPTLSLGAKGGKVRRRRTSLR